MSQHPGALAPHIAAAITKRTARLSVVTAFLLIILKAGAWVASGSVAMLSSLADSGLDLAAALFTLFAVGYAATPPDREHRYGHGKAEAMAALCQAALIAGSGIFIAIEAVQHLLHPAPVAHGMEAIAVMLVSLVMTGVLVRAQTRAIKETGSVATSGDRAHYLSDFAANIVVLLGIACSTAFGWTWADGAAGLLVVAWLIFSAFQVAREAANHLMDHELPNEERQRIRALAMADGKIAGVHDLIIHPDPGDRAEPHGGEVFAETKRAAS